MTLSAHQRTHVLVRLFAHVLTATRPGFVECRTCRLQFHSASIVTVGATNGIDNFVTPFAPRSFVEFSNTLFAHDARHVGTLTSPASTRLYIAIAVHTRCTRAKNFAHIFYGMFVTTRSVIFHSERITCPKHHHFGAFRKHILALRTIELTFIRSISCHCPRLIFTGEVFSKLFVGRNDRIFKYVFAIVVNAHHLSATLKERGNDEPENEDCNHRASK